MSKTSIQQIVSSLSDLELSKIIFQEMGYTMSENSDTMKKNNIVEKIPDLSLCLGEYIKKILYMLGRDLNKIDIFVNRLAQMSFSYDSEKPLSRNRQILRAFCSAILEVQTIKK
jgi:hypothetical protein